MGRVSFAIAAGGAGERRHARRRRAGGADRPRRGGRARERRADPGPDRALQRRPEADPRDARRRGAVPAAYRRAARGLADGLAGGEAERRAAPAARVHGAGRRGRRTGRWSRSRRGSTPLRRPFEACRRGEPSIGFAELYFQTAYDPSVAPPGRHTMSVFAQYAPLRARRGRLGLAAGRDRRADPRRDRRLRARRPRLRRVPRGARAARHRARASASPAATSSRARRCRTRCGTAASTTGPRSRASTCAARPPIPAAR